MCSAMGVGMGMFSGAASLMESSERSRLQFENDLAGYRRSQAEWGIAKRAYDDNYATKVANAILQTQQVRVAQRETNEAAAEEKSEIAREMMRAKATASLAAGEAGVSGNVVDRILTDIGFTEQRKYAAVEASRENAINQKQAELQGISQSTRMNPIYHYDDGPPQPGKPGYLAAAISGMGTGVAQGITDYYARRPVSASVGGGRASEASAITVKRR